MGVGAPSWLVVFIELIDSLFVNSPISGRFFVFDGVISGHIHHAEIKEINGVTYMNDGDWVESCTALVEHHDGRWEIVTWTKQNDKDDTYNN